jgi:hypothetical protein
MMMQVEVFRRHKPDIAFLEMHRDVAGLIRLLGSREPEIQMAAADALARIGSDATAPLINALGSRNRTLRLGIITALAEIGDARALHTLVGMTTDASNEIRWQVCIALGNLGHSEAIPALLLTLRDRDKYVRYASAISLSKIGYTPVTEDEQALFFTGMQDWERLVGLHGHAVPSLIGLLADRDAEVRCQAIRALGAIGSSDAGPALTAALGDEDRQVRWEAMLASQKCGVPPMLLPRGLCRRPRLRKNPLVAGFLNFLLPGLGYGYLGKWWGIMIFQIDITTTVWLFKYYGEANTYGILFPLYIFLGIHAWYITKKMPEEPP